MPAMTSAVGLAEIVVDQGQHSKGSAVKGEVHRSATQGGTFGKKKKTS